MSSSATEQPAIDMAPLGYNAADFTFVQNMIAQHQQALQISAAVPQSSSAAVVALSQKSISTLQADLSTLKVFLVQWTENPDAKSGSSGPAVAPAGLLDAATVARLGDLQGDEFDALWLRSMRESSSSALEMATDEVNNGQHPDAVALARQMVKSEQTVLADINELLTR